MASAASDIRKRKPWVVIVPDFIQEVFTDRLLSARKEVCSRESLKESGLQSEENKYAVEGKCSEEKPRVLAQRSYFKGTTLRSREGVLG